MPKLPEFDERYEQINKVLVAHAISPTTVLERGLEVTKHRMSYLVIERGADGKYLFVGDQVKTSRHTIKLTDEDRKVLGYE